MHTGACVVTLICLWHGPAACVGKEEGEALERQAKQLNDLGYSAEIISKSDVKRKEPHVVPPPQALSFRTEAAAEPGALTHMLLSASQAKRLMGCAV